MYFKCFVWKEKITAIDASPREKTSFSGQYTEASSDKGRFMFCELRAGGGLCEGNPAGIVLF